MYNPINRRTGMPTTTNLCQQKLLIVLHGTSTTECLDQVPATSLLWNSHSASRWQCTSITSKNCYCHSTGDGRLERQGEVHEWIKCNRDFVTHRTNQS